MHVNHLHDLASRPMPFNTSPQFENVFDNRYLIIWYITYADRVYIVAHQRGSGTVATP